MKMKTLIRKQFLLLVMALSPIILCSGKDDKAKEILDKASVTFAQAGGIKASFTFNIKDVKAKVTESFDGTIQMKGDRFCMDTPDYELWFNGKTQWIYMKGVDEVNISEPSKEELQMLNPSVLFNIYKNGFKYKYLSEKTDIKGKQVYEIELTPLKKNDMVKMIIQIGKISSLPHTITIVNKNNIDNIIHINKYETGNSYADSMFSFDKKKYPNVEIIDLRD